MEEEDTQAGSASLCESLAWKLVKPQGIHGSSDGHLFFLQWQKLLAEFIYKASHCELWALPVGGCYCYPCFIFLLFLVISMDLSLACLRGVKSKWAFCMVPQKAEEAGHLTHSSFLSRESLSSWGVLAWCWRILEGSDDEGKTKLSSFSFCAFILSFVVVVLLCCWIFLSGLQSFTRTVFVCG